MPSAKNMIDYIDKISVVNTGNELVTDMMSKTRSEEEKTHQIEMNIKPSTWDLLEPTLADKKTQTVVVTPKKPQQPVKENTQNPVGVDLDALFGTTQTPKEQAFPQEVIPSEKPSKITKDYVVGLLKAYEEENVKQRSSYQKKTINAYDLTGCIRKLFYGLKGTKEEAVVYPYGEIVHGIGNTVHEIMQKRLPSQQNELKIRVENQYEFTLNMRSDILWNDNVVVEVKTIESIPSKAKDEHVLQALFYAYLLNTYLGYRINLVQLLYVSRGKVDVEIFDVDITEEIMLKVGLRIKEILTIVSAHLKENVPPPMDNKYVSTDNCKFCGFAHACQSRSSYKSL